ncbi:MAG: MBL fold metallo-hydrolase [Chloroflexi bacterium]|nr:MBL fold metallo-hydrolase [Chloroflexota bacterium]
MKVSLWLLLGLAALLGACTPGGVAPTSPPSSTQPQVAVTFFDVGESGDGILVATWEEKYMLIDGGRRNSGVVGALQALQVPRIDVLVATNPDADHIGGLIDVLKTVPVGEVWLSGDTNTTITFEDFLDAVSASQAEVHAARQEDVIRLGSLSAQVVNPSEPLFQSRNDNSVALRLEFGQVSFLFTGDMEAKAEGRLVQSGVNLRATILKLGHHGSRTSTSAPFLAAVQPEVAVYQAGADNRYGHPHPETLALLAAAGVPVYGTGRNGVIVITTDGAGYRIETER